MSRRAVLIDAGLLAAGLALLIGWHVAFPWFLHVTGTTDETGRWYAFWSGFGSDLGEITIAGAVIDMARRAVRHHAELLAQNAKHHRETLAQDAEHHAEHLALLRRHHQQQADQADQHHEALKAHLTSVAESQASGGSTPFPSRERLDGPPATIPKPRKPGDRS